ncbi:MAG: GAF domain-containing protein, partial [Phycisphaerales bacterium]
LPAGWSGQVPTGRVLGLSDPLSLGYYGALATVERPRSLRTCWDEVSISSRLSVQCFPAIRGKGFSRLCEIRNMIRPYAKLADSVVDLTGDRVARMQAAVDTLWDALHSTGVSWVGFYLHEGKDELILGPWRNEPACSRIGLHGACGQAFRQRKPLVVRDVTELGDNYIACDPRDRSEVVLPLFDESGSCWGVLDLDSRELGAFDNTDIDGLQNVLHAAGLTHGRLPVDH